EFDFGRGGIIRRIAVAEPFGEDLVPYRIARPVGHLRLCHEENREEEKTETKSDHKAMVD
ncbi:MAG TPA: hypothetical protein VGA55_07115, partial [Bacteroidota bacterium]